METRVCRVCEKELPLTTKHFYRDRNGFNNRCISCTLAWRKEAYQRKATEVEIEKPKITKRTLREFSFEKGKKYDIKSVERKKETLFRGELVCQNELFCTFRHEKHGYYESFMKIDFINGEIEIKEVI